MTRLEQVVVRLARHGFSRRLIAAKVGGTDESVGKIYRKQGVRLRHYRDGKNAEAHATLLRLKLPALKKLGSKRRKVG